MINIRIISVKLQYLNAILLPLFAGPLWPGMAVPVCVRIELFNHNLALSGGAVQNIDSISAEG